MYDENCELVIGRTYAYAGPIDDHTHNRAPATGLVMWMGGYPLVLLYLLAVVPGLGLTDRLSLLQYWWHGNTSGRRVDSKHLKNKKSEKSYFIAKDTHSVKK